MKRVLLIILIMFYGFFSFGQELAKTEDGRTVFLKKDGTYEFVKTNKSANKTNGEIQGVVNYFFNDNYGDKPDVGAKVIIRKVNKGNENNTLVYDYIIARNCEQIIENNRILGREDSSCEKKLKKLKIYSHKDFDKFSEKVSKYILDARYSENSFVLSVNGSGNFSKKVEPGKYEIIVTSNHVTYPSVVEALGNVTADIVDVKAGEQKKVSFEFNP